MKYVKGNFLPTRQFRDMADLNAQVRDWVPQVAGQRIHGTTRLRTPHMCLQEGKPRWQGLPDGLARRLHIYYVNGGQLNIDGFYAPLSAHVAGKAASGIADPIMFPTSHIYHPDHPGLVFDSPTTYLRWKGAAPVIAIALHQRYLAAEQTAFIDDLIRRIEKNGAIVYVPEDGERQLPQGEPAARGHKENSPRP